MTEQQDGFLPELPTHRQAERGGHPHRQHRPGGSAHDYTRENLRPETLPIFIKLIWQDLAWENILLPKQGMDHAVILLGGSAQR